MKPIEQTHPSLKGKDTPLETSLSKAIINSIITGIEPLKGMKREIIDLKELTFISVKDVQEHTIDKQVIRDLIYKIRPNSFSGRNWKMVLKKELGL